MSETFMKPPAPPVAGTPPATSLALIFAGVVLLVGSWMLPVNLKSLSPVLLREAGRGTPSLTTFGLQLVESEKPGPAALVLAAAQTVGDPQAARLATALTAVAARQKEFVAWGGWDPFLDPLFNLKENTGRTESTPVLTFFIAERARDSLRRYLANSRSLGVQAVMQTRGITRTARFVPATQPGGQPLDAVILLTALLYQGEHLSPSLQREIKRLADDAVAAHEMGELEWVYLDLLALGRRLNWIQLSELLRLTNDTRTVSEFAHLAQVAPDQLPLLYTAALFTRSADSVAAYLLAYGKPGAEDLRLALGLGQGAVQQLVLRQVPVNRGLEASLPRCAGPRNGRARPVCCRACRAAPSRCSWPSSSSSPPNPFSSGPRRSRNTGSSSSFRCWPMRRRRLRFLQPPIIPPWINQRSSPSAFSPCFR
jgi:hypothetical protein